MRRQVSASLPLDCFAGLGAGFSSLPGIPNFPPPWSVLLPGECMKPQELSSVALATGLTLALVLSTAGFAEELPRLEETQREALTSHKREETIEQLKRIIPKIDDRSAQKADLLYQLSELYVEKSKELLRSEMANYDAQYRSYEKANKRGAPQADH